MALSRKHFREIARILGENLADDDLINEFVSFCASQNQYFQKQTFIDAIEKEMKETEMRNNKNIEEALNEKTTKLTLSGHTVTLPLDDRLVCKNNFK